MRHNNIILTALFMGLVFFGCKKYEPENLTPKITDDHVEVTDTTATFTWTVDWLGKLVSVVEVSKNEDMTDSRFYGSEEETNNHDFTVTATGLKEATKYYYRFLVWNKFYVDNKFVMEVEGFTTEADVPKVKTVEVNDVTRTSATVVGEVIDDGGAEVTECGVCWSTSQNPTTSGSHATGGTGLGSYSVALSGLEVGMTYYARAYAINSKGTAYGEELEFVTGDAVKPTVTTAEITNIDWRSATGGGEVIDDGDATVTERGICWSTSHNPTMSGNHANNGTGTGVFTVQMNGLTANTTYYVRAYAINSQGTSYGSEVTFTTTANPPTVTTSTITNITQTTATGGGNVTDDGGVTVNERGICWSTNHNPNTNGSHATSGSGTGSFTANMTGLSAGTTYYVRAYAINSQGTSYGSEVSFTTAAPYTITVAANPSNGGTAIGGGTYTQGQSCTISATANTGFGFINWTENGNVVSTSASYNFTVSGNRTLVANFTAVPTGAIDGLFTINANGDKVWFSQGNLQYQASTSTWRFATNQYDYIGDANSNISSSYSGWIDLFGWGTSGWDCGNTYYRPWDTNNSDGSLYGPHGQYNLTGSYANSDWGYYNVISNGGNASHQWRTLTQGEWDYVFNTRSTSSGIRYAKAQVNNINGVILLPDDWSTSYYSLSSANTSGADYMSNVISLSDWANSLQSHGAVFLPAAGNRFGTSVHYAGSYGYYWSSSYYRKFSAYSVYFLGSYLDTNHSYFSRSYGFSVRLARVAE